MRQRTYPKRNNPSIPTERPLMRCGHVANAVYYNKGHQRMEPCCSVCAPDPYAYIPNSREINIAFRTAVCPHCGHEVQSNFDLPYFKYCPDAPHDTFYDGCLVGLDKEGTDYAFASVHNKH